MVSERCQDPGVLISISVQVDESIHEHVQPSSAAAAASFFQRSAGRTSRMEIPSRNSIIWKGRADDSACLRRAAGREARDRKGLPQGRSECESFPAHGRRRPGEVPSAVGAETSRLRHRDSDEVVEVAEPPANCCGGDCRSICMPRAREIGVKVLPVLRNCFDLSAHRICSRVHHRIMLP